MTNIDCQSVATSLLRLLENGTPMSDAERTYLRECPKCSSMLDAARQLQQMDASTSADVGDQRRDATITAAERELRSARRRRTIFATMAALLVALVSIPAIVIFPQHSADLYFQSLGFVGLALGLFFAVIVLPLSLVQLAVSGPRGDRPIYRRLGPGRKIAGVCLGLAEANNVDVSTMRLIFVGMFFVKGLGLLLYVLLALTMQPHPADREHLLRFKLRRAFSRG